MIPAKPHSFAVMDGLRGVAALAVVLFHLELSGFSHGYLAVDFFFMMSGFVLTHAYQQRLDAGWTTAGFLKARYIRLYPLYALGLVLGATYRLLQTHLGRGHLGSSAFAFLFLLGSLMLPAPPHYPYEAPQSFPFDSPMWSLFYELLANVGHALCLRRRGWKTLAVIVAISWIWLLHSVEELRTLNFGPDRNQLLVGLPRIVFAYTLGSLLYRLWRTGKVRWRLSPWLCASLLVAAMVVASFRSSDGRLDLLIASFVFPPLLLLSASSQVGDHTARIFNFLGATSYGVYVLHLPIGEFFTVVISRLSGRQIALHIFGWGGAYLLLTFAVALLLERAYDLPARAWLRRKLNP